MKKQKLIAAGTVLAAGLTGAPALAAATGANVSVRVEGLTRTVLADRSVTVPAAGSITKDGIAAGLCPTDTAQGALQAATGGYWKGRWYASYKEYEITGILDDTPNAKRDYFEIFVNHVAASTGACEITLKAGDTLLFAVVPDSGRAETPLSVSTARHGTELTATVTGYTAKGIAARVKGATVTLGSQTARTAANGTATLSAPSTRTTLVATARGHIRDETTVGAAASAA